MLVRTFSIILCLLHASVIRNPEAIPFKAPQPKNPFPIAVYAD